jgi:beta-glucosidase
MKKLLALGMATVMGLSLVACGKSADSNNGTDTKVANETEVTENSADDNTSSAPVASGEEIAPDAEGTAAKWTEEKTADGWVKVTNEGGKTLGYSANSGVKIVQVDGYAFKDLDRDGMLDVYEDWRRTDEERASDLTSKLSEEEMTPLFTHGGWTSFGATIEGDDLTYVQEGGRGGVTRSALNEGNTSMAVSWVNALQELCESTGNWGIPATISVDPNHVSNTIDQNSLAATMSVDEAFNLGVEHGKQYRAVGITMLLGPQVDIGTQPTWTRATGTFSEDPALNRDLANAYISGLQSTWAEDGTDLGWGEDSVYAIAKHFVGAGASEGGRNDHMDAGKYTVYPGNNFEAHLIPFLDGAFNLSSSSTKECGVMPNYAMSYSKDGSLGELVGGGYSEYKLGLLKESGYDGFILTDWQITNDGQQCFGVEDYTMAERFMLLYKAGVHQVGGTADNAAAAEGYDLLKDEVGDDEALTILKNATYHFLKSQMQSQLFDNAYITEENAFNTVWNNKTDEESLKQQLKSIIMLKNSNGTIAANNGEKKTVYVPYLYTPATSSSSSTSPATCEPAVDLDVVSEYFNVVTDSVNEPSGTDDEGNPEYQEEDIVRASADQIAACDMVLMFMDAPSQDSAKDDEGNWNPASLQYSKYTAKNARRESIAGDITTETINDGYYGTKTQDTKENRSYAKNTVGEDSNIAQLKLLEYVDSVCGDAKVVVIMSKASGPSCMVWSEVEPHADAILFYYGSTSWVYADALLQIVNGDVEPSALLPYQQPASMDAVEAQNEDVPRDLECYKDADGNTYDFAFGLNWSGVISDERTATYSQAPLTNVNAISFHYAEIKENTED